MIDYISNLIGGDYGNKSTTTIIILILLLVVIIALSYNYWHIYSHVSVGQSPQETMIAREPFEPKGDTSVNTNANMRNEHMDNNSSDNMNPMVRSVIDKISQFKEGEMSESLQQYYDKYNATKQQLSGVVNDGKNYLSQIQHAFQFEKFQDNMPNNMQETNPEVKSEAPEKGIVKLIVYHMPGCGPCGLIMKPGPNGEKSKYEQINDIFKNDRTVKIIDYQLGRDKEADKFRSFPTIMIVTEEGRDEYRGPNNVVSISKAIVDKKH